MEFDTLIEKYGLIRLSFFAGFLTLFATTEAVFPRRALQCSKISRWFSNLSLSLINGFVLRLIFSLFPLYLSIFLLENKIGLFNIIEIPLWGSFILSIILLDLVVYFSHILFHKYRFLWRMHKVHHTDLDFDVTTGIRFHPFEAVVSMLIKIVAVAILGIHPIAFIIFEILLNASSLFEHSNIHIPAKIDKIIRFLIVTPDMHRVHHSTIMKETNSNYGFNLSIWDRLFKTYIAQPEKGHLGMDIGLNKYREEQELKLMNLLLIPIKK